MEVRLIMDYVGGINILCIVVIVILLIFSLHGMFKGLIGKLAGVLAVIAAILVVRMALPYVTDFVRDRTPVYTVAVEQCDKIAEKLVNNDLLVNAGGNARIALDTLSRIEQTKFIQQLPLPKALQNAMLQFNNGEGYSSLGVSDFGGYVVHFFANLIVNIVAFLATFVLAWILVWAVLKTLDLFTAVPGISGLNRAGGFLLGLAEGLIFVWIILLIISISSGTEWGGALMKMVEESKFLSLLYDYNILAWLLQKGLSGLL